MPPHPKDPSARGHTGTATSPSHQRLGGVRGSSAVWTAVRPDNQRGVPSRAGEVRAHWPWVTTFGASRDPTQPKPPRGGGCHQGSESVTHRWCTAISGILPFGQSTGEYVWRSVGKSLLWGGGGGGDDDGGRAWLLTFMGPPVTCAKCPHPHHAHRRPHRTPAANSRPQQGWSSRS